MNEDYKTILADFKREYGINLWEEMDDLPPDVFYDLLSELSAEAGLVNLIHIRKTENQDELNKFNKAQRQIRKNWRKRDDIKRQLRIKSDQQFTKTFQENFR